MGLDKVLNIASNTMSVYQQAMNVASNNISNSSNPNYTRQTVIFGSAGSDFLGGNGVKISDIQRVRNNLLDVQVNNYQSASSDASKRSSILSQVESVVSEPSTSGLSADITDFFDSWSTLATQPNSSDLRSEVIQKAQTLSDSFNGIFNSLNDIQTNLQQQATADAVSINQYLAEITSLNQQIHEASASGVQAGDLQDERDGVITSLSQLVNVTSQANNDGTANVSIGGVMGADSASSTSFQATIVKGQLKLVSTKDASSAAVLNSGELSAISDLYSNKIPSYISSYQTLANTIVNQINAVHMTGFTLEQNGTSSTGIPFFGELDNSGNVVNAFSQGELNINSNVLSNPSLIAASDTANSDANGSNATNIANLIDKSFPELGNKSILDSYTGLLDQVGTDKTAADNKETSTGTILTSLQTQQASISGVSMDEEMTNVLKYQRVYQAAAKLISISDALMSALIGIT
jgi:flagellar hook-associated protein 1